MRNRTSLESTGASTGEIPPAPPADSLGRVEVSPEAIATIAAQAVMENGYGVVGFAARRLRGGRAEALKPANIHEGLQVRLENDGSEIIIDLYVIMEYNIRISEVAHNIMSNVKFEVERHIGLPVSQVNVNVQGLGSRKAD